MPADRSNKQAPTKSANDGANHTPRRSPRLTSTSEDNTSALKKAGAPAKRVQKAKKAKATSDTDKQEGSHVAVLAGAGPASAANNEVATRARPIPAPIDTKPFAGCCALKTPCDVCFSHDQVLTPVAGGASASEHLNNLVPNEPMVGMLHPAVWSSTASEFEIPQTPVIA